MERPLLVTHLSNEPNQKGHQFDLHADGQVKQNETLVRAVRGTPTAMVRYSYSKQITQFHSKGQKFGRAVCSLRSLLSPGTWGGAKYGSLASCILRAHHDDDDPQDDSAASFPGRCILPLRCVMVE